MYVFDFKEMYVVSTMLPPCWRPKQTGPAVSGEACFFDMYDSGLLAHPLPDHAYRVILAQKP